MANWYNLTHPNILPQEALRHCYTSNIATDIWLVIMANWYNLTHPNILPQEALRHCYTSNIATDIWLVVMANWYNLTHPSILPPRGSVIHRIELQISGSWLWQTDIISLTHTNWFPPGFMRLCYGKLIEFQRISLTSPELIASWLREAPSYKVMANWYNLTLTNWLPPGSKRLCHTRSPAGGYGKLIEFQRISLTRYDCPLAPRCSVITLIEFHSPKLIARLRLAPSYQVSGSWLWQTDRISLTQLIIQEVSPDTGLWLVAVVIALPPTVFAKCRYKWMYWPDARSLQYLKWYIDKKIIFDLNVEKHHQTFSDMLLT